MAPTTTVVPLSAYLESSPRPDGTGSIVNGTEISVAVKAIFAAKDDLEQNG